MGGSKPGRGGSSGGRGGRGGGKGRSADNTKELQRHFLAQYPGGRWEKLQVGAELTGPRARKVAECTRLLSPDLLSLLCVSAA